MTDAGKPNLWLRLCLAIPPVMLILCTAICLALAAAYLADMQ